jgi:hypothetical protein
MSAAAAAAAAPASAAEEALALDFYAVDTPSCINDRKLCKRNPKCLHGLLSKRDSIWSKTFTLQRAIGRDDPRSDERNTARVPYAGLVNLGSTCFFNTLLQFLCMHVPFRNALLTLPPPAQGAPDTAASLMQQLFARLALGTRSCESPLALVDHLGWKHDEQQVSKKKKDNRI